MRLILALLVAASPASAWEFAPSPLCTLSQATDGMTTVLTYDPALPEYTITITLEGGQWPDAPVFAMGFVADSLRAIQTDRHTRSADGRSLTVADTGFGNVLDGLQSARNAYATAGDLVVDIPLDGIAGPLAAFRDCPAANLT